MKLAKTFAILTITTLFTVSAFAQIEGNPENWCRDGFFTRDTDDFRIGRITGLTSERAYFYKDDRDDCPDGKNCRAKAYLVTGDEVIVGRSFGRKSCVWYTPVKGAPTSGWLDTYRLKSIKPDKNPNLSTWLGEWTYARNGINFTENKLAGYLNVTGDATWQGIGANVHVGEIDERVEPTGNLLKLGENETGEYACKVKMHLIGKYLVVADNLRCGGANVTFSGIYTKRRPARTAAKN